MKHFSKLFLRGVFTLLPFGLTVIILFSFLKWIEKRSSEVFSVFSEDLYFPGLGLLIGVAIICLLGYLTTKRFMGGVIRTFELPFKNVPILRSVYSAVKSLSDYFSPDGEHADQQVVVVKWPGFDIEVVGLVTRQNLEAMPPQFTKDHRIAVFIPLSYQVGGLTVFIPRNMVKRVDMKVEEAMRSSLTAWMPNQK